MARKKTTKSKTLQASVEHLHRELLSVIADPKIPQKRKAKLIKVANDLLGLSRDYAAVVGRGDNKEGKACRRRIMVWLTEWAGYLFQLLGRRDQDGT